VAYPSRCESRDTHAAHVQRVREAISSSEPVHVTLGFHQTKHPFTHQTLLILNTQLLLDFFKFFNETLESIRRPRFIFGRPRHADTDCDRFGWALCGALQIYARLCAGNLSAAIFAPLLLVVSLPERYNHVHFLQKVQDSRTWMVIYTYRICSEISGDRTIQISQISQVKGKI